MCNYMSFGIDARIGYGLLFLNNNNVKKKDLIVIDQILPLRINVFIFVRDAREYVVIMLK